MLLTRDLHIELGPRVLLKKATFTVNAGDKVGLVGHNGAGKSTLISVLTGEPAEAIKTTGTRTVNGELGYVPQVPKPEGLGIDTSVLTHILSGRGLDRMEETLKHAQAAMEIEPTEDNITTFTNLEERFRTSDGYIADVNISRLAAGIGLSEDALLSDLSELSGGQRRRVELVRTLFMEPDVMILDEPTNHLDVDAKAWLMTMLSGFGGALLIVSHDLHLLDAAITKVFHLEDGEIIEYRGTYTDYKRQEVAERERRQKLIVEREHEVKRLTTLADSMRGSTARRARVAKSLDKRVEQIESTELATVSKERKAHFRLPTPTKPARVVLDVADLGVAYGPKTVINGLTFSVEKGNRTVVLGLNGAGKSTLLKALVDELPIKAGTIAIGRDVSLGYYAQEHEQIVPGMAVIDHIPDTATITDRRAILGGFGLHGDVAFQDAGTLSGGEKAKLAMSMLSAGGHNVLLLDEPTNNLDPASKLGIAKMFAEWEGTLILVSHDREFVDALDPTHVLLMPESVFSHWKDEYSALVELT